MQSEHRSFLYVVYQQIMTKADDTFCDILLHGVQMWREIRLDVTCISVLSTEMFSQLQTAQRGL